MGLKYIGVGVGRRIATSPWVKPYGVVPFLFDADRR